MELKDNNSPKILAQKHTFVHKWNTTIPNYGYPSWNERDW